MENFNRLWALVSLHNHRSCRIVNRQVNDERTLSRIVQEQRSGTGETYRDSTKMSNGSSVLDKSASVLFVYSAPEIERSRLLSEDSWRRFEGSVLQDTTERQNVWKLNEARRYWYTPTRSQRRESEWRKWTTRNQEKVSVVGEVLCICARECTRRLRRKRKDVSVFWNHMTNGGGSLRWYWPNPIVREYPTSWHRIPCKSEHLLVLWLDSEQSTDLLVRVSRSLCPEWIQSSTKCGFGSVSFLM